MLHVFSDNALSQLSAEIDRQLQLLKERSPATVKGDVEAEAEAICPRERRSPKSPRNRRPRSCKIWQVTKADLCEEGGMLYQ